MTLRVKGKTKEEKRRTIKSYTLKEKIQQDYKEVLEKSTTCINFLKETQKEVVKLLPVYKKNLSKSFEEVMEPQGGLTLLNYIKLLSIYKLVERHWKDINEGCRSIAKTAFNVGSSAAREKVEEILDMIKNISNFKFNEVIEDSVTGFFRLNHYMDYFFDFNYDLVYVMDRWSYRDITGTIFSSGISEDLWSTAVQFQYPSGTSVGDFMDQPSDEETAVMYSE